MYENQKKKRARAINAAVGKASTGTHQLGIEFEFLDEPGGITYYGALTDAAFEYTMKAIRTAGFVGDDLSDLESLTKDTPEVILVIDSEEYPEGSGTFREKVKFINSLGGLAMKDALQGEDLKGFAKRMKGKIVAYDRSAGAAKARSAPQSHPHPSDAERSPFSGGDDIPF